MTVNPAAARAAALVVGFGIVLIPVRRPVAPGGSAPASDAGGLHAAQFLLELPDLVPESCRELELKLGRRRVHLVGQHRDQLDQVLARRAGGSRPAFGLADAAGRRGRPGPRRRAGDRGLAPALPAAGAAEQLLGVGILAGEL